MRSAKRVSLDADAESLSSSETCYAEHVEESSESSSEFLFNQALPASAKIPLIVLDEDDDELEEELQKAAGDEYKCRLLKHRAEMAKKRAGSNKVEIPSSMEMAKQLGIDWIGAIDPGTANCALCVVSAVDARIVYWRVIHLNELCALCEEATGVVLKSKGTYSLDSQLHAITWWCQQDECPFKHCDMVVVERQSFRRNMAEVQAAWIAAFATHKPAVSRESVPLKVNGVAQTYTMTVPKAMVISSDTVKTKFRGFFPMIEERPAEAAAAAAAAGENQKRRKRTYTGNFAASRTAAYGMGDADGDPAQYAQNKANAKRWCRKILGADLKADGMLAHRSDDIMTEAAQADFESIAVAEGTMTVSQLAETAERLSTAKCDDLADAMFMAFYAADFIVGTLWKRAIGPTAKTYTTKYEYCEPPPATMNNKAQPEARHQVLFAYIKYRVKPAAKIIAEIVAALK